MQVNGESFLNKLVWILITMPSF